MDGDGDGDDVACWTEKNIDFTHFDWVKTLMIKENKERVVARPRLEKFESDGVCVMSLSNC